MDKTLKTESMQAEISKILKIQKIGTLLADCCLDKIAFGLIRKICVSLIFFGSFHLAAQVHLYETVLEPITIPELGGLQSYAYGTQDTEWIIFGGRLDGLHMRQPFAAFTPSGNNNQIIVVNPISKQVWKASTAELNTKIREQLTSSNMQFIQVDNMLLITGGYSYSPSQDEHITYPLLTIVNVSNLISAVKNGTSLNEHITQIEDERFAVTGGQLDYIDEKFYLVGGHKFTGRYNPIGANFGPGFKQEYTNEVRTFSITREKDIVVTHYDPDHDEWNLHRRDFNLVPQYKDGQKELMVFSGVFQHNSDVPWLQPVRLTKENPMLVEGFKQKYNHYHCANLPIYNQRNDEMHTIFFGGIAQFYEENDTLIQDNDIPFVKTIADVSRIKDGSFVETKLSEQMSGFLGAGSEFIIMKNAPLYDSGILDGDQIEEEFVDIGYIFGGIKSSMSNIFWINDGTQSAASSVIYKVSIRKLNNSSTASTTPTGFNMLIYPNPAQEIVRVAIEIQKPEHGSISIFDNTGKEVESQLIDQSNLIPGYNLISFETKNISYGSYLYKIKIGQDTFIQRVLISEP